MFLIWELLGIVLIDVVDDSKFDLKVCLHSVVWTRDGFNPRHHTPTNLIGWHTHHISHACIPCMLQPALAPQKIARVTSYSITSSSDKNV